MNLKINLDSLPLGILLGILAPAIAFFSYYFINYRYMSSGEFINFLALAKTSSALVSLCVLANLLLFYIFIQAEKYLSAKGILLSTFLYGGLVVYLKFFTPSL